MDKKNVCLDITKNKKAIVLFDAKVWNNSTDNSWKNGKERCH